MREAFFLVLSRIACACRWLVPLLGMAFVWVYLSHNASDWAAAVVLCAFAIAAGFIGVAFGEISLFAGACVGRLRQQKIEQAARQRLDSGEPYFLYLRSFAFDTWIRIFDDNEESRELACFAPSFRSAVQYFLAITLKRVAPMLGIGRPTLSHGMANIESSHADWRQKFERIANGAAGIFVLPSLTKGSHWELGWLWQNALEKPLIIVPPVSAVPKTISDFWDHYADFILMFCGEDVLSAKAFNSAEGGVFRVTRTGNEAMPFIADQSWPLTAKGVKEVGAWLLRSNSIV